MSSYTVEAILKASTSQFISGMREAAQSVEKLKSATASLSSMGDSLIGIGSALTAGITAPLVAGVTSVIKSYADLEQAVGGVETLFKDSANAVIANSETAYQRAGVSGVKYMEQVTSFSATLLQGLGGDTVKAAAYGDKAIVQMSDNANKMGTSIESIQMAYQGFAKDNYTMLDNLKLGYGGTASEMARLVNESGVLNGAFEATAENVKDIPFSTLIDAIQVTQDKLGITGTTAKEASETVSGSFQSMLAAGQNLVAGLGSADADVGKLMENLKNTISIFVKNIKRVLRNIWDNLPMAEWQKWVLAIAAGAGPILLAIGGITKAVNGIGSTFSTIGSILSNPFGLALVAIAALVAGFVYAYNHSETFRNKVNAAVEVVKAKFNELKATVQPVIDSIVKGFKKTDAGAFAPLIAGAGVALIALKKLSGFKLGNLFKFKFPALPNPFSKLANFAKSAGSAVKGVFAGIGKSVSAIFKGIGSGIANIFRGIASSISMLNPVGVASFALGVVAVTTALVALSAVRGMILPFLQGLANILVSLVGGVLQAFVGALIALQPVMFTMATALSMLSPLIVAVGQAFATASPFVSALGAVVVQVVSVIVAALPSIIDAISGLVTAIAAGIAQIVVAITPIVQILATAIVQIVQVIAQALPPIITAITPVIEIISNAFTTLVQIVANAIVQVVQALAPFIPAITEMVVAVAPVLAQVAQAFSQMVAQIAPIIQRISGLVKSMGEAIKSAMDGVSNVINSIGGAVKAVLDGLANVFRSIGTAAKDAGTGFKSMAQGVKMLDQVGIIRTGAILATVAAGMVAVGAAAVGFGSAGTQMKNFGQGLQIIATYGGTASSAMGSIGTAITNLSGQVQTLPTQLSSVSTAMQGFATSIVTSFSGLLKANSSITALRNQLTSLNISMVITRSGASTLSSILLTMLASTQALAGAVSRLVTSFSSVASAVSVAVSGFQVFRQARNIVQDVMTDIVSAIIKAGFDMAVAGKTAGNNAVNNMSSGINEGRGIVVGSMQSLISAVRSTAMSGVEAMRSIGAYIGQGLAQGMYSALGAVTAAANALVAQAERAAQAKAKIHSPSRLFRDNVGIFIGQGVAVGIDRSTKYVKRAMNSMFDGINDFSLQVGDLMSDNLAYNFETGRVASSVDVTYRREDSEQLGVIREALSTIKDMVARDVVLEIDGQEFARTTGDDMTEYQRDKRQIEDLLRGIR